MRPEKRIVKAFYDTYGWRRAESGLYHDSVEFADRRPVLAAYERTSHRRVKRHLGAAGRFFLDAGSGPLPNPDDLDLSTGFERRVCVDLSRLALIGARERLGRGGFYVQADVTSLPFRSGVFAASLSAHVLYHVPSDEQERAVREMYRTLAPGGSCVIVYACPRSPLSRFGTRLGRLARSRLFRGHSKASPDAAGIRRRPPRPPLYFHAHELEWLTRLAPSHWDVDVRSWRVVDAQFTRAVVSDGRIGRLIMSGIAWVETVFPRFALRLGGYPMVVIRKLEGARGPAPGT